ncbi:AI-2E family transporter [Aeromicrobium tamlense]|uniref:AI-2E family transporter n=1 Tax=Aeromicrobium tamlense TaxID=375541 RepID=A0A8I0KLX2_9ACTN|nr:MULTISPECIES: AI-2E family transporter [Aeromicrobium]MBD1270533.1 AI-2E family transporter [Aeromicrobium tamlense]MBD1271335.1 AI-2E family transporter [Aeromicrobium tamlense]NYI37920.1 putative PurR-regulated permease PerM [Aeromicrobium tamlense]
MTIEQGPGPGPTGRTVSGVLTFVVGAAALTIVLGGVHAVASIIGPVFLALVITVTVHPARRALERTRLPEWAASTVMLIAAYLLIVVMTLALVVSVAQLAALLPKYTTEFTETVNDAVATLEGFGVEQAQLDKVAAAIDPARLVELVASILGGTLGALTDVFFLFTVLLFMAFDTNAARRNLHLLGGRFGDVVTAVGHFADGTRTYMVVAATFGLIVAIVDGVALYVIGVPGAFVWAVLAFVTNFIPNIGFVIGLVPPALIALLEDGPGLMLAVIVVYCVVNFVIQSIIQPRVVGESVGLSPTLTFLSLVFWAWLLGPLGALLAVPLSLLMKAMLVEADPRLSWALPLISGRPETSD